HEGVFVGAALELADGTVVTGSNSPLLHAASGLLLNAAKTLAGIPHAIPLLSPGTMEAVARLKKDVMGLKAVSLDVDEVLICLSLNAPTNPVAQLALDKLKDLRGAEVHLTHMPTPGDEAGLKRLGLNLTSEPNFATKNLFVS
ncbi:MAG: DUF1846 family protein, partial [Candidatus Aminicenantes bacterium]|nr:DUF1846 family protein [Candidatus Aminicenantes bacterium]